MCYKSSKIAFVTRQIKTTSRNQFLVIVENSPLTDKDKALIYDILSGLTYKELSVKYHKSESRIYKWKRSVLEKIHEYEVSNINNNT